MRRNNRCNVNALFAVPLDFRHHLIFHFISIKMGQFVLCAERDRQLLQ